MNLLVSEVPVWFVLGAAFFFGAAWGSFFNVAIYRWPRDLSVVTPASACPSCHTPIPARYNIPILGYFILRGKTACCGAPLSLRYPVVELLTALLAVAVARHFVLGAGAEITLLQASLLGITYFFFVGGLLVATFVDLEFMEIPDEVSLPGAALGLATAVFRDPPGVEAAALGAGASYLVIQVVFVWSYEHLLGRRGMGEGDSKLLMMIGAFVGWQGALFAVFAGAAQGLLAFIISKVTGLEIGGGAHEEESDQDEAGLPPTAAATSGMAEPAADAHEADALLDDEPAPQYWGHFKVPFGPFLALGALEYLFFGEQLTHAWLALVERLPLHG
ncbi:MAG TPA: prepilin peptidase [Polyangiales bacterium]